MRHMLAASSARRFSNCVSALIHHIAVVSLLSDLDVCMLPSAHLHKILIGAASDRYGKYDR